jgi:predicted AAA+ superfamily ATPase
MNQAQNLDCLSSLIAAGERAIAIQSPLTERFKVLEYLSTVAVSLNLPLYFGNQGYSHLQQVVIEETLDSTVTLVQTIHEVSDLLRWLLISQEPGIFVIEGAIAPDASTGLLPAERVSLLTNIAFKLANKEGSQLVIYLEPYVELPLQLIPFLPVLINPFPTPAQIGVLCRDLLQDSQINFLATELDSLIRICLAIPLGELELVLRRAIGKAVTVEEITSLILEYKKSKFRGRGVEFVNEPDVPSAAGLDLLDAFLERTAALLRPEAALHDLQFTRGILLWGPPGTGKSLSAKLAARKLGVPMVCADWGGLRGATAYESRRNLKEFLETCDTLGKEGLILYFDDFDKGFAGFDADNDGGIARQMAGKLLTWMQEHTSKVLVFATINRLNFIPPELIRRFEENIFFIDLPHAGARYQIFKLHLSKYAPELDFSEQDWRKLLNETHLLTPAEISNLVKRAAAEVFYQQITEEKVDSLTKPLEISVEDLLEQRKLFTPSLERDEDQIITIRNQAHFARPAASEDTSIWAKEVKRLFE